MELDIPRDRNGTFDPQVIPKYERNSPSLDNQIITLYAKGNSTRQIADFARELYGVEVSADMVSAITDRIWPEIEEWQSRPLQDIYSVVFLDGIHYKVREHGCIVNKCAYIVLGITIEGYKDLLGIWVGEQESASYWLHVLNDIKNR